MVKMRNDCCVLRYNNVSYNAGQEFLVDDKDKEELLLLGSVIVDEKVINKSKVETPVETEEKKPKKKSDEE